MPTASMTESFRHPEVLAKRASKGDGPGGAAILRGPLRGRLRMTVNVKCRLDALIVRTVPSALSGKV
jgi:hypothetical protein